MQNVNETRTPAANTPPDALISQTIADQRLNPVIICTKASQLHFFGVLDLLGVTVAPFNRHFGVCIGVDQDVEGAVTVKDGEESNGRGDLAEDCLDFVLDFFFGLFDGGCGLGITAENEC